MRPAISRDPEIYGGGGIERTKNSVAVFRENRSCAERPMIPRDMYP